MSSKLLSCIEAANMLQVGSDTLRQLARDGKIAHYRGGDGGSHSRFLFSAEDISDFQNRGRVTATRRVEVRK